MRMMGIREGILGLVTVSEFISGLSVVLLLMYCTVGCQKTMLEKRGETLC